MLLASGNDSEIDIKTKEMLADDANLLYTSSVCIHELIVLRQAGKAFTERNKYHMSVSVVDRVKSLGVGIVYINELHLRKLDELPVIEDHKDQFDRLIIAQAIADKATLVSSDGKFPKYKKYGLDFHRNTK